MVIKHLLHANIVLGTFSYTLHREVITPRCKLCILQLCFSPEEMRW